MGDLMEKHKPVGVVGLGRMGGGIAARLAAAGHTVYGYDMSEKAPTPAGITRVDSLATLREHTDVILLLVPAGEIVDSVLMSLVFAATSHEVLAPCFVVDCGNSLYIDTIARHNALILHDIIFSDAGVSGGVHGAVDGYCVMAGGDERVIEKVRPYLTAIAMPQGFAAVGPIGAGHYVKMIHNAIEYGVLQAYGEGFHLLKENNSFPDLNLQGLAQLWQHGSIIRSHILHLLGGVLADEERIEKTSGVIHENGTGRWALHEARKQKIELPVIEQSLKVRSWSRESGGNHATKLVALLRNAFGGHPVE